MADRRGRGVSLREGLSTARDLKSEGIKVLDVSCGRGAPRHVVPEKVRYSDLLHLARAAKLTVSIPVIGVGGIRHPDLAEQALQDGMADLIAVGRGILADPGSARKTLEDTPETMMLCRDLRFAFTILIRPGVLLDKIRTAEPNSIGSFYSFRVSKFLRRGNGVFSPVRALTKYL